MLQKTTEVKYKKTWSTTNNNGKNLPSPKASDINRGKIEHQKQLEKEQFLIINLSDQDRISMLSRFSIVSDEIVITQDFTGLGTKE